jgi:asparagine synthase (glutamine-hydrolysing)
MCGIAGYISTSNEIDPTSVDAVRRMSDQMQKRGPDAEGIWTSKGVVLGHRRLAILDLDRRSDQPMVAIDGNYAIAFNGEIYNFRELRTELEGRGVAFRTTSDTEVLLALYALEGERMLPRLRGMFAFATWSVRSNELFLARDPYGIKPLYYAQTESGLVFASQVKAVLASKLVSPSCEAAGVAGFYLWGSVPEPWTLYRGVFALPAGHWLRVRAGEAPEAICWNDIRTTWRDEPRKEAAIGDLQNRLRAAVTDSVRAHLVSDVPVCVFLSGGIDSGTIAGLASELGAQVEGITVGFDEFSSLREDETSVASAVAKHFGLRHHVRKVTRAEFEEDTPHILNGMDQPSIDGVNTWFASKAAAERGYKVALSGIGGDELFRGYTYMEKISREIKLGKAIATIPGALTFLKGPFAYLAKHRAQPKFKGVLEFIGSLEGAYFLRRSLFLPQELLFLMGKEMATEGLARLGGSPPGMTRANAVNDEAGVCLLDSTLYLRNQLLRDSDWASMHHSLELRTPLVDGALLDALKPFLPTLPSGAGKAMLANSPANPMPKDIINLPKTGFSIPMNEWLIGASDQRQWAANPLLAPAGTPWARRWAATVMGASIEHEQFTCCPEIEVTSH